MISAACPRWERGWILTEGSAPRRTYREGIAVDLVSSAYQLALAKVDAYERLAAAGPPNTLSAAMLREAREALAHRMFGIVPVPLYDSAWARLNELRWYLCLSLPLQLVGTIIDEIGDDVSYLEPDAAQKVRTALKRLEETGLKLVSLGTRADARKEAVLRAELQVLSRRVASAREGRWLKVNMIRNRLLVTGVMLSCLLVIGGLTLAKALGSEGSITYFVELAVFGAVGGCISVLIGKESLNERAADFYVHRRLLYLRPVMGAGFGVIAYLAVKTDVISILGIKKVSGSGAFLVLAFVSGFAERLVVNGLLHSDSDQKSTGKPPAPRNDGETPR
jgi:hypothetical protein